MLEIDDAARIFIEERGLRAEELEEVFASGTARGAVFVQPSTRRALVHGRLGEVAIWAECEGRRLTNVYSHRMQVQEGLNMPSTSKETESGGWRCGPCGAALAPALVKLAYLGEVFEVDFPACPACGQVYISEAVATGKLAKAERMLEDK